MNWAINLLYQSKRTVAVPANFGIQSTRVGKRFKYVMLKSNAVTEYLCDKSSNVYGIIMWKNSANFQDGKNLCFFFAYIFRCALNKNNSKQTKWNGWKKNLHLIDVINLVGFAHSFNPSTVFDDRYTTCIYRFNGNKRHISLWMVEGVLQDVHLHTKLNCRKPNKNSAEATELWMGIIDSATMC